MSKITIELDSELEGFLLREGIRERIRVEGRQGTVVVTPASGIDVELDNSEIDSAQSTKDDDEATEYFIKQGILRVFKSSMDNCEQEEHLINSKLLRIDFNSIDFDDKK